MSENNQPTEENHNTNLETESPAQNNDADSGTPENVRKHEAFKQVTRQLAEERAKNAAYEQAKKDAAEKKALEEGEHLKLIEQLKGELSSQVETNRKNAIREKLRDAGMHHHYSLIGAVESAPKDMDAEALTKWVEDLKDANPNDFAPPVQPPNPVAQPDAGTPNSGTQVNWSEVYKKQKSSDRKERLEATEQLGDYRKKHGSYPPEE
jgi:hypothetical protein